MNAKAAELGLDNTHFENPHGLNAPGHCSSAGDMAVLMAHCMKHEYFAYVASMKSTVIKGRTFINHNRLLRMYDGCIGGKTGYTEKAGRCLVSAAERDGTRFICVTLSAPDDWNDHIKLYDYAFANYSLRNVTDGVEFSVPVISGEKSAAALVPEEIRLFLHNSDELELVAYMPEFVFAPVRAGEKCGEFYVMKDDECLARGSLLFRDDIETKRIFRSTE